MRRFLPWLILLFPVLELWVLIQVGKEIGALATVALVVLSCLVGISLLRLRGMHIARSMQAELAAGRLPSNPIIDTFCLMVAGWLFLFPGFVSDAIAVLLLIPGVRRLLLYLFAARMRSHIFQRETVHFESPPDGTGPVTWTCATFETGSAPPSGAGGQRGSRGGVIIDCEPEVTADKKTPSGGTESFTPDKPN